MEGLFLSFVIPVYNGEAYLSQCLDSLLRQDIPREEYEILCINDGSTDGTGEILERYRQTYPSIRVIHQENSGVATARNVGISQAVGAYIWFVDADDLIRKDILGTLRAIAQRTKCQRIVLGGYAFTDVLSPEERERACQGSLPSNVPWEDSVVWRSLFRREFLSAQGLSFRYPELTHGEDGLFMYEVSMARPTTQELPDTVYFYRLHSGSADTSDTPASHRRKLTSYLRITQILHEFYHSGRRDPETANRLMTFLWFTLYEAAQLPRKEDRPVLEELKRLGLYPGKPLPECTMTRTYLFSLGGIPGRILDDLSLHFQTPWAYGALRTLLRAKRRIRKSLL